MARRRRSATRTCTRTSLHCGSVFADCPTCFADCSCRDCEMLLMRGVYSTRYPLLSRCQSACGHAPLSSGGVLAVCMQHARACMHVSLYVIAVRTYYFMCVPLGSGGFHRDFRIRYSRRTLLLRHVVAVFYILCHAAPVLRTRAGGGARAPASPTTTPDSTCTHQPAHGCGSGPTVGQFLPEMVLLLANSPPENDPPPPTHPKPL